MPKIALVVAVFAISLASASMAENIFNCSFDPYCLFNISSERWSCHYEECLRQPNLTIINVTNVTIRNDTIITFANYSINLTTFNCNETSLMNEFSNKTSDFFYRIESEFNTSGGLLECKLSRETLKTEVSSCTDRVSDFQANYMLKEDAASEVNFWKSNATLCSGALGKKDMERNYFAAGGLAVGAFFLWLFRYRKTSREGATPQPGDFGIDQQKVEEEARQFRERLKGKIVEGSEPLKPSKSKVERLKKTFRRQ